MEDCDQLFSFVIIVTSCLAALAMSYAHWITCCVTSWMSDVGLGSAGSAFLHSDWSLYALEVNRFSEARTISERGFFGKRAAISATATCILSEQGIKLGGRDRGQSTRWQGQAAAAAGSEAEGKICRPAEPTY